ncbi:biotin--[acetyl-CoA-carboxylase] ligase [Aeromicrobium sp. SMF47]|uniref:Biotin--[acetyl-CoA-carboxylase] ligase n=1 Tax=Aeromicrobium yanjiei TaxID=2662028 RepID=A0A5Q2MBP5_9ACTN|nr:MULTISPECIES: biotin--[acetyl-CoA-carboxylase] ligase [Aeromicrobium]MRJ75001.1 biotin--[acetyl-CoA-carboxylase] ligase [Aeromicrobium yanjiei]MRK02944.1 biotin--[acetyl-CoA-carboxylase] ligase [Aeromicrobium sp. S22]QGG40507.1 biotin--[acetyl-CoA-carboxylase] ligase [Aeromicrobium yanjiei]
MSYRDLDRPPLDTAALRSALTGPKRFFSEVVVTAQTGSTNADVAAAARSGAPEGLVHVTDAQTAGRGRLDRTWESPAGSGAIVSVLLRPDGVPPARWVWLPLLAGLAVDATVQECGVGSSLKWPNDVLVDGRKIAGILLERTETPIGPAAVVGVGLNVSLRRDELPTPAATSLLLEGATETDRTIVIRAFLRNLEALYRAWSASGGDPAGGIRDSYVRRCVTIGQRVRVTQPHDEPLEGLATGIDEMGRLLVDGRAISAGDVTHVRPAG